MIERGAMIAMLRARRLWAAAALLAVAVSGAGCSKKLTTVDAGFTTPEGRPDPRARLYVQASPVLPLPIFNDVPPPGPDPNDTFTFTDSAGFGGPPGSVLGVIIDHTPASSWQVLRREPGGGLKPAFDFLVEPSVRFVEHEWDVTTFLDPAPSGYAPPTYIGRGEVQGAITSASPLTNESAVEDSALQVISIASDSLRTISWNEVPGAVGYYVQVYQFSGGASAALTNAMSLPLALASVRNALVVYEPADPGQPPDMLLTRYIYPPQITHPPAVKSDYLVRITAVNANGTVIGMTRGDPAFVYVSTSDYGLFSSGAKRVAAGVGTTNEPNKPPLVPRLTIVPATTPVAARALRPVRGLAGFTDPVGLRMPVHALRFGLGSIR